LTRPHPDLLPREKEQRWQAFVFADECPANSVAGFLQKAATASPSPWGEGRDEGERQTHFPHHFFWTNFFAGRKVKTGKEISIN
jgi:hypothetical protein